MANSLSHCISIIILGHSRPKCSILSCYPAGACQVSPPARRHLKADDSRGRQRRKQVKKRLFALDSKKPKSRNILALSFFYEIFNGRNRAIFARKNIPEKQAESGQNFHIKKPALKAGQFLRASKRVYASALTLLLRREIFRDAVFL